ncbi:MAG: Omp28-related outer membrane protein [Bacteroidales bacterium]|nr:Omp28-related outer membrane protein [Bacteroidales bacterium]
MKTIKISILVLAAILFFSCDEFKEDELITLVGRELAQDIEITKTQDFQAVYLEEHTGWGCNNCPRAAEKLEELSPLFGEKLIAVAIHAGSLSEPNRSNRFLDLRTDYGNSIAQAFGINARPMGVINRKNDLIQYNDWESHLNNELSLSQHSVNINMGVKEESNEILVGLEFEFLQSSQDNFLISVFVVEDNIIGIQRDGEDKVEDYVFNNVLRQNPLINLPLNTESVEQGQTIRKNYKIDIAINEEGRQFWNLSNCRIIVLLTEKISGKVVQANQIKIRN